jgi:hypothetical protein
MNFRPSTPVWLWIIACLLALPVGGKTAGEGKVEGSFVVAGVDAQLKYVRARRIDLDGKGKTGYAVLLSARMAAGDIAKWKTAEPSERGSFIYVLFDKNGQVWAAELGHRLAKSGRFGVVTELQKAAFAIRGRRLIASIKTAGDQTFFEDRYSVDLRFEATLDQ